MNRRLPPDAFAYYLGLGVSRSYQTVADHFGVSKQAVVALAGKEGWVERLVQAERRIGASAEKKAEESISTMNDRHLRSLKAVQGKALEALRSLALDTAMDAVRALDLAIRQERVIRGEPGDRSAIDVGDLIRREHERWLTTAEHDAASAEVCGEPDDGVAVASGETASDAEPVAMPGITPPSVPADDADEDDDGAVDG